MSDIHLHLSYLYIIHLKSKKSIFILKKYTLSVDNLL
nr:MAG TPA: hypothetical protein [Caudoviricetes sp.]